MKRNPTPLLFALSVAGLLLAGVAAPARAIETTALLDTLQHTAFDYFWNEANPTNGLIKDRSAPNSVCSIASTGFGLSAICIGIDHGWVSRAAGRARIQTTLDTFLNGPQDSVPSGTIGYQGWFYHWLDMNTARRTWDSELSSIDTALLLAGMIDAREYFDQADSGDSLVRATVDSIVYRVNWNFMRGMPQDVFLRMAWKPGSGFSGFGNWVGYNEAMILYILAIGGPVNAIPGNFWQAWDSGYDWRTHYGYSFVEFPPLFGHQYSHCWVDFRYIQDDYMRTQGITYFENSRRATLAQHAYCIDNPENWTGYSEVLWGITASDVPGGYLARGAPPEMNDNGTIAPTAAASSIAFTPEIVIPTLHNMFDNWPALWTAYGFRDAFNPHVNWYGAHVLGIDQGPIILMIENYRTVNVWRRVMRNPWIQSGLTRAGFTTTVGVEPDGSVPGLELASAWPNPMRRQASVRYRLPHAGKAELTMLDLAGRELRVLDRDFREAGDHIVSVSTHGLPRGVYFLHLRWNGLTRSHRIAILE
jgi:hypothetical protein